MPRSRSAIQLLQKKSAFLVFCALLITLGFSLVQLSGCQRNNSSSSTAPNSPAQESALKVKVATDSYPRRISFRHVYTFVFRLFAGCTETHWPVSLPR